MRRNPVRAKLKSQEGASILFALFFFIVCAVIGSIVLTAATAAAGRMKDVEKNNRYYYAVNSAADLLEEEINDPKKTMIEIKRVRTGIQEYKTESNGTVTQVSDLKDVNWSAPPDDVPEDTLGAILYNTNAKKELTLKHGENDPLNLNVKIVISGHPDSYNREIQISCINDENPDKHDYSLVLQCTPHEDKRVDTEVIGVETDYKPGENGTPGSKIEKRSVSETETNRITWTVTSVNKGGLAE